MTMQHQGASPYSNRPRPTRLRLMARHTCVSALLFVAFMLLIPTAVGALEPNPAGSSTLDTSHMTLAEKLQAHLEGDAVISLVGMILCFAGGACLVVMVRRDFNSASRRTIREAVLVSECRRVVPINSYRATTAALRSARLAEAALTFGLAEPEEQGARNPADTDQLLDRLLEDAGQSRSRRRWSFVLFGEGKVVRFSSRFAGLSRNAREENECQGPGETRLSAVNR